MRILINFLWQITDQRERYDRAITVLVSLYLASLMGAFGDKVSLCLKYLHKQHNVVLMYNVTYTAWYYIAQTVQHNRNNIVQKTIAMLIFSLISEDYYIKLKVHEIAIYVLTVYSC